MLLIALLVTAEAAWPEDVTISGMTEHNGLRVADTEALADAYYDLVRELGATDVHLSRRYLGLDELLCQLGQLLAHVRHLRFEFLNLLLRRYFGVTLLRQR